MVVAKPVLLYLIFFAFVKRFLLQWQDNNFFVATLAIALAFVPSFDNFTF